MDKNSVKKKKYSISVPDYFQYRNKDLTDHMDVLHFPVYKKCRCIAFIMFILIIIPSLYIKAHKFDSITYYIQKYDYQKIIDLIDNTEKYNSDEKLIYLKATAYKELKEFQKAIDYFEILYWNDSSNIKKIIELADCYQSLGNHKKTQKLYNKALILNPKNNYIIQQLADSYFIDNNYKQAKEHYLSIYLTDSSFYLAKQLARCYNNLDIIDMAILYYHKSILFNPIDFESSYSLANLYKQKEVYHNGIIITDTFLNRDSSNIKMLKLSGYLHFLNKDYYQSTEKFEKCILLNDTSDFVNKYLGFSYFKLKEYEKAKEYLEKAFFKDTSNVDLCYALGISCDYSIYKKLGIEYLKKTIDLMIPSQDLLSQVYQDLAHANTGFYKYEEALEAYFKAFELTPNDTLLIFKIANHYDNWIKDKNIALTYYEKFMETRPKKEKNLPQIPAPGEITISYYDFVEKRIKEIKEEIFWQGKKQD